MSSEEPKYCSLCGKYLQEKDRKLYNSLTGEEITILQRICVRSLSELPYDILSKHTHDKWELKRDVTDASDFFSAKKIEIVSYEWIKLND